MQILSTHEFQNKIHQQNRIINKINQKYLKSQLFNLNIILQHLLNNLNSN